MPGLPDGVPVGQACSLRPLEGPVELLDVRQGRDHAAHVVDARVTPLLETLVVALVEGRLSGVGGAVRVAFLVGAHGGGGAPNFQAVVRGEEGAPRLRGGGMGDGDDPEAPVVLGLARHLELVAELPVAPSTHPTHAELVADLDVAGLDGLPVACGLDGLEPASPQHGVQLGVREGAVAGEGAAFGLVRAVDVAAVAARLGGPSEPDPSRPDATDVGVQVGPLRGGAQQAGDLLGSLVGEGHFIHSGTSSFNSFNVASSAASRFSR